MQTHRPTFEGWLTEPPRNTKDSEGHASAVRVLRNINSPMEHTAAEPVPFSARKPTPPKLRSIKPAPRRTGCAGAGSGCINHPDCPDTHCEGHPDNMGTVTEHDPRAFNRALAWLVVIWVAVGVAVALVGA
jgi:hypothetical protein